MNQAMLEPGDQLEIKFTYAGQFNQTQTIRPDGTIELPLVGSVTAQGRTPEQLQQELIKLFAAQLKHPELVVLVHSFHSRRVYVGGAVNSPGVIQMPGQLTVLEAIMQSGGFNLETAELETVLIIRRQDNKWTGYVVDCKQAVQDGLGNQYVLQPRDIVYVPRTKIADVNQWLSQHIYKILPPLSIGIGYSYP